LTTKLCENCPEQLQERFNGKERFILGYEIRKEGDILIVKVSGEFDLHAADFARRDIDIQIRTQGVKHILFDLGGLTFIDSSGLGVILGRYRKISENGGRGAISGAHPNIQKVMEISGLPRLMPFFVDCASALRELG
jgi:stage II sporulation protein AA (anti-sigma F factor antagonist)